MAWTAPLAAPSSSSARPSAAPGPGAPAALACHTHHCAGTAGPRSDLEPSSARLRRRGAPGHRGVGDPTDPQTPTRIRAFVDQALPQVGPQVSARLLIQLADLVELEVDLRAWGRYQALCRAVAAVHLSR